MPEDNTQPLIDPPPPDVMRSGDSQIWADAFIAAASKQPHKLLDRPMVELWCRAMIGTGFIMGQRQRSA